MVVSVGDGKSIQVAWGMTGSLGGREDSRIDQAVRPSGDARVAGGSGFKSLGVRAVPGDVVFKDKARGRDNPRTGGNPDH